MTVGPLGYFFGQIRSDILRFGRMGAHLWPDGWVDGMDTMDEMDGVLGGRVVI